MGACASIWSLPHKGGQQATSAAPPPVFHYLSISLALTPSSLPSGHAGQLAAAWGVTFLAQEETISACVFLLLYESLCMWERDSNLLGSRELHGACSVCHNLLLAVRDGAASGHPGGSSRGPCDPEEAGIFWSYLISHHWCSRCQSSAPCSQVWTPGVPQVPGKRTGSASWSQGLEQGHASTWCSSYWAHPGAPVVGGPRRLQHWGKFIFYTQKERERESYTESSNALERCHMSSFSW